MPVSVFEIESAQGLAVLYNDSCVFVTHTEEGTPRKKTVFLSGVISVELCECELVIGTACGAFDFSFDSDFDASRFEEKLISRISEIKNGANAEIKSAEDKMRIGEDEFAAALFGDEIYEAPVSRAESPADFLSRLNDADVDEIISVLQGERDKYTDEELERIEAVLVMKTEM